MGVPRDPAQPVLDGLEGIDLLTGVVRRFAEIRAAYPETSQYTGKWCAWQARGGKELRPRPNQSDEVAASKWLAMEDVQKHIRRARTQQEGVIRYGGNEALADLVRHKAMSMGDAPVRVARYQNPIVDKEGNVLVEGGWQEDEIRQTDLSAAKASLELLLKHFGLLRDRLDLQHSGAVAHLAQLDDAALEAHIRRLATQAGVDLAESGEAA